MRDFFHGWRRKLGCATLLIALLAMGIWVRSLAVQENFDIRPDHSLEFARFQIIPYWSIVIPLTLLSAYLLIVKPREAKSVPIIP